MKTILEICKEKNITLEQLAEKSGINITTLNFMNLSPHDYITSYIDKVAEALNCKYEEITDHSRECICNKLDNNCPTTCYHSQPHIKLHPITEICPTKHINFNCSPISYNCPNCNTTLSKEDGDLICRNCSFIRCT